MPEGALTDGALPARATAAAPPSGAGPGSAPPLPPPQPRLESLQESLRHFWFLSLGSFITFNVIVCLPKCLQTS